MELRAERPWPGIDPAPPTAKRRILTTGSPGTSSHWFYWRGLKKGKKVPTSIGQWFSKHSLAIKNEGGCCITWERVKRPNDWVLPKEPGGLQSLELHSRTWLKRLSSCTCTHARTHTPWPNESETLGMGPGNLTPGAADAGWSSWATSTWWNLILWASWKSTKDHSCQRFRGRRQAGNSLQIRGEGESGQLTRAIFPDNLSLIPFWNVGSQYLGREVSLGQDGKGGPGTPNSPDQTRTPLRLAWDLTWSVF